MAPLLPGNVAKYRLILDVREALQRRPGARILDVGCVGPSTPLELWTTLFRDPALRFSLTGIDVFGLERASARAAAEGWAGRTSFHAVSAYDIGPRFGAGSFDLVICTQVLEHLARYPVFIAGLAEVLDAGGEAFLSCDSAHFGGKFPLGQPAIAIKRLAKRVLARLGNERQYDVPLYDRDLEPLFKKNGLTVQVRRYYNLGPLKRIHNHVIEVTQRDEALVPWWTFEEAANRAPGIEKERPLFRCLYYHLGKGTG